jgi:hypothetical protein
MNTIYMDFVETSAGGLDWIGLAQDRDKWRALVNAVMKFRVPKERAGELSSGCTTGGLSSSAQLHLDSRCCNLIPI